MDTLSRISGKVYRVPGPGSTGLPGHLQAFGKIFLVRPRGGQQYFEPVPVVGIQGPGTERKTGLDRRRQIYGRADHPTVGFGPGFLEKGKADCHHRAILVTPDVPSLVQIRQIRVLNRLVPIVVQSPLSIKAAGGHDIQIHCLEVFMKKDLRLPASHQKDQEGQYKSYFSHIFHFKNFPNSHFPKLPFWPAPRRRIPERL